MAQIKTNLQYGVTGTIPTANIADDAITAAKLADDSVVAAAIADDAVVAAAIADDAVVAAAIADNAVITAAINADAITAAKVADDVINSEHLVDGGVDDAHLATGIASSKLTGALPAISGASLTGLTSGLSVATIWRINATWSGATDPVINFEQADSAWDGNLGTMSYSSGIFTFPSTGIYGILFKVAPYSSDYHRHTNFQIEASTDGTNYGTAAEGDITIIDPASSNHHMGTHAIHFVFDVTNTTNCKVKFKTGAGPSYNGNSGKNYSYAQFTRYGDT